MILYDSILYDFYFRIPTILHGMQTVWFDEISSEIWQKSPINHIHGA